MTEPAHAPPHHELAPVTDIRGLRHHDDAVRRPEARFRRLFDNAPVGMAFLDDRQQIVSANDALCRMLEYSPSQLAGRTLRELTPAEDVHRAEELTVRLFAGDLDRFTVEKRLVASTGRVVWAELNVSRLDRSTPREAIAMISDVTARKCAETELIHRATHDPLTSLPNRNLLDDRIQLVQARSDRSGQFFAVLYVDLDGFKSVNDRHGHATGDDVLTMIAGCIAQAVRPSDTVARVGGDEFVVLCEDLGAGGKAAKRAAAEVATRVRVAVSSGCASRATTVPLSASIGIVVARGFATAPAAMIAAADTAMYVAKTAPKSNRSYRAVSGA